MAKDLGREIGAATILDDVSVSVAAGERIGLVGPNGAGKTTLLKLVAGREMPDRGTVQRARGVRVDLLAQEARELPGAERALHAALPGDRRRVWELVAPDAPGAPLSSAMARWPGHVPLAALVSGDDGPWSRWSVLRVVG